MWSPSCRSLPHPAWTSPRGLRPGSAVRRVPYGQFLGPCYGPRSEPWLSRQGLPWPLPWQQLLWPVPSLHHGLQLQLAGSTDRLEQQGSSGGMVSILNCGFNKLAKGRQGDSIIIIVSIPAAVCPSSRGHRHGPGGRKHALWPSSALQQARALSLGFPGNGCLGWCLGSPSSGLCLRRHAGTSSQRIIDDRSEGSWLA